jgi:hypothetical protein
MWNLFDFVNLDNAPNEKGRRRGRKNYLSIIESAFTLSYPIKGRKNQMLHQIDPDRWATRELYPVLREKGFCNLPCRARAQSDTATFVVVVV